MLHEDADDYSVSRSLEAYLLWLFGAMMFSNTHGDSVDKVLMVYAREIADAPEDEVPTWSWGSAVLAATYRGLCEACSKNKPDAILSGCPLLLQLWAYERTLWTRTWCSRRVRTQIRGTTLTLGGTRFGLTAESRTLTLRQSHT